MTDKQLIEELKKQIRELEAEIAVLKAKAR